MKELRVLAWAVVEVGSKLMGPVRVGLGNKEESSRSLSGAIHSHIRRVRMRCIEQILEERSHRCRDCRKCRSLDQLSLVFHWNY